MNQKVKRVFGSVKNAGVKLAAVASGLVASAGAMAQTTPPDASTQLAALVTGQASYATNMFALALAAVGIMIGVKWIKRGRGAA